MLDQELSRVIRSGSMSSVVGKSFPGSVSASEHAQIIHMKRLVIDKSSGPVSANSTEILL